MIVIGCLDPYVPLLPSSSLDSLPEHDGKANSSNRIPALLRLPAEIMMMILSVLPPSSLISFFRSSEEALDYADIFLRRNPEQFYRCTDNEAIGGNARILIPALASQFPQLPCPELDVRWEIVSRVTCLAHHLCKIPDDCITPTVDVNAPLQYIDHAFGFWELSTELPVDLEVVKIYGIEVKRHYYVCGIELFSKTAHQLLGSDSKVVCFVDMSQIEIDIIRFAVDRFGIRSLKFGRSPWVFGNPEEIRCWDGFSERREDGKIRIVQDALKFRQIGWCSSGGPTFAESVLRKERHAFQHSHISREGFWQRDPRQEADLVSRFGNFTAEAVWLDQDLRGITRNCDNRGMYGITIHTSSKSYCFGFAAGMAKYFPLQGLSEVLAGVDIHTHSEFDFPLVRLKTNWNRKCFFGPVSNTESRSTTTAFRPMEGFHIKCLYFRMGTMAIESLGVIYAPGVHGSACPVDLPMLAAPRISWDYDQFYESCARLSDVSKVRFYYDSDRCTGLELFYSFGGREVLGRLQSHYSNQITVANGKKIRGVHFIYEANKLKNLSFETEGTKALPSGAYNVTGRTVCASIFLRGF
ncbi:hypothetical protein PHISCL_09124 [Aspergillus sclerotialis]|uniref:F-box domain-containing protein n=1 Tax=Aspergillus sclerotialis TaxID=2070753 RepID=A0A3A2Z613_9EURO|nr:hypothetical protein PHISCL_09124 [Aspergillus sclerotialis]